MNATICTFGFLWTAPTAGTITHVAALLFLALLFFWYVLPPLVDRRLNRARYSTPLASEKARALHAQLLVVDGHADSLLWGRDLLQRANHGHVDIPRLIEANVALQAFTVVTKTPWQLNYQSNEDTTDSILPMALAQRWPMATWWSLLQRALHQANQLVQTAHRSHGLFRVIRSVSDLDQYLKDRSTNPRITAGWLGIEGAHALDDDPANVDVLFDAGFRMMAPTHFFDNAFGGSAAGVRKIGLTDKGHRMIERMQERGMVIDLAHASSATISDVVAVVKDPLVVSHTGVRGTCDNQRNLSDDEIRAITSTGGVIGIGYWADAVGACETQAIINAILYVGRLVGFEHVGLGSDFDGTVETPFDTCGLVALTDGLLAAGLDEQSIRNVMGENYVRVLRQVLPD